MLFQEGKFYLNNLDYNSLEKRENMDERRGENWKEINVAILGFQMYLVHQSLRAHVHVCVHKLWRSWLDKYSTHHT